MGPSDAEVMRRGRTNYEIGRLRRSSRMLLYVVPVLACGWLIGRPAVLIVPAVAVLSLVAIASAYVHLRYEKAVLTGIAASVPALLLPWAIGGVGLLRIAGAMIDPCIPACVVAGGIAGAVVAVRASGEQRHWSSWLMSAAVAGIVGAVGCSVAGEAGVLGMAIGALAGSAPVIARREWRGA